jgi:hypothetical protein
LRPGRLWRAALPPGGYADKAGERDTTTDYAQDEEAEEEEEEEEAEHDGNVRAGAAGGEAGVRHSLKVTGVRWIPEKNNGGKTKYLGYHLTEEDGAQAVRNFANVGRCSLMLEPMQPVLKLESAWIHALETKT